LRRAPVKKLSTQRTIEPLASRRSQRCEPRKPAPPVNEYALLKVHLVYYEPRIHFSRGFLLSVGERPAESAVTAPNPN
jgi:hypothetical protein